MIILATAINKTKYFSVRAERVSPRVPMVWGRRGTVGCSEPSPLVSRSSCPGPGFCSENAIRQAGTCGKICMYIWAHVHSNIMLEKKKLDKLQGN